MRATFPAHLTLLDTIALVTLDRVRTTCSFLCINNVLQHNSYGLRVKGVLPFLRPFWKAPFHLYLNGGLHETDTNQKETFTTIHVIIVLSRTRGASPPCPLYDYTQGQTTQKTTARIADTSQVSSPIFFCTLYPLAVGQSEQIMRTASYPTSENTGARHENSTKMSPLPFLPSNKCVKIVELILLP